MVYVPDGTYILTGPLQIGDNTHLQMSAGATLKRNFGNTTQGTIQNKKQGDGDNKNIRISGGTIEVENASAFGKHLVFRKVLFLAIENLRILGVAGAEWNTSIIDCEDVTVCGLVIRSGTQIGEDGLHFAGGRRIAVTNSIIECGDDALSFTNEPASAVTKELEDVVVSNCYLFSRRANALRIQVVHELNPENTKRIRRVRISNIVAKVGDGSGFGSGVTIFGPAPSSDLLTDVEIDGLWLDASQSGGGSPVDIDNVKRVRLHRVVVMQPLVRVTIDGSTDVELRDCVVDSPQTVNSQCLLVASVSACSNIRIIGGYYRHARDHAIILGSENFTVTGFEVSDVLIEALIEGGVNRTPNGLWVRNATGGMVFGNKITGCLFWGINEYDPSNNNLYIANRLTGNVSGGLSMTGLNSEGVRNITDIGKPTSDSGGFRQTIDGWFLDNVASGITTAQELQRYSFPTPTSPTAGRFRAVRRGSVTGVVVTSTEDCTAGSLTVTVFRNVGLAGATTGTIINLGLSATLDTTPGVTSRAFTTQAQNLDQFHAGDELFLMVTTTAGWMPTSADIRCAIEIED